MFFKIIFVLNELESVEYLRQGYLSLFPNPITLGSDRQRLFKYLLVGRECNSTWTVFKRINPTNSSFEDVDTNLNLCTQITYPNLDTNNTDDNG